MAAIRFDGLNTSICHPNIAEALAANGAGQCWASAEEMKMSRTGDYPHGKVEDYTFPEAENEKVFQRIWHDDYAIWFNTYA